MRFCLGDGGSSIIKSKLKNQLLLPLHFYFTGEEIRKKKKNFPRSPRRVDSHMLSSYYLRGSCDTWILQSTSYCVKSLQQHCEIAGILQGKKLRLREVRSLSKMTELVRGGAGISTHIWLTLHLVLLLQQPTAFPHLQMSVRHRPPHTGTHTHTFVWMRTFWVLAVSAASTFIHFIQLTFLCWVHLEILAGDNRFLASSEGSCVQGRHTSLGKEEKLCTERDFEPKGAMLFLSILEVSRCWKTIEWSQLYSFFYFSNNPMLDTLEDPDSKTTGVTCLRFVSCWVLASLMALLYSRFLEGPEQTEAILGQ